MPGTAGRSGRKHQPTHLRALQGDRKAAERLETEPQPGPGAPEMPADLSEDARYAWMVVVPELDKTGMLCRVDLLTLVTFCEDGWARGVQARRLIAAHGLVMAEVVTVLEGGMKVVTKAVKNPAVMIARDAAAIVRSFASEFGLTPAARARLTLPEKPHASAGADLLSG